MSLKTWKAEFYPKGPTEKMSTLEAIKHSLRKWEGLRRENLAKHGMAIQKHSGNIFEVKNEDRTFGISSDTCSLCVKFFKTGIDELGDYDVRMGCKKCPITISTGKYCDDSSQPTISPYHIWVFSYDPEPMISALKKTLEDYK